MRKTRKIFIIIILLIGIVAFGSLQVFAKSNQNVLTKVEYSQDFKTWLELPEEEKEKTMKPKMYENLVTKKSSNNLLYKARLLGASISTKYNLKDVIPENIIIKNQKSTNSCWTFAALSSLETNLALNSENTLKIYDYSERHMEYYTSNTFANNQKNKKGYNRNVGSGGQWYIAESYLTNGSGAINESDMPFEDNEDLIDISKVQNKEVTSQIYDTVDFVDYSKQDDQTREQIISEIKKHIQNYGAVFAAIHGASSSASYICYNNTTGAKYCNDSTSHKSDHAVSIIGWDDNYSIDNFSETSKPNSKGAWIIRNSWGEKIEYKITELKELIFNTYREQCLQNNWNSASDIPNELITSMGYTIENDIAYTKVGDNGLMYVSYEDCNISKSLYGIIKASDTVDYENIYQYNEYYPGQLINSNNSTIMLCNIFEKKTSGKEYISQIALNCPETYTCKVYVNPNGTSKNKDDMQLVQLKAGEYETFDAGYHTIEFAKPIEIKSNNFAVIVEIQGTRQNGIGIMTEAKIPQINNFNSVTVESGKCFLAFGNNMNNSQWIDLGNLSSMYDSILDSDSSIKVFTISEYEDDSLANIEISNPPTKTKYIEGQDFDKTGMIVKANYNNNTSRTLDISSYSIKNGTNLKLNQTSVIIEYEDKSVEQAITVEKNSIEKITIKNSPNKVNYIEGQNFDKTGMIIEAIYKDGSTKIITDYSISNGNNLVKDQTEVTIVYDGKTVQQAITVVENKLIELKITKEPDKLVYIVGQNFDITGMVLTGIYQDSSTQEIVNYTIKNGKNLLLDQTYVTIEYNGKEINQNIIVEDKEVVEINISKNPSKLQYIQNKEELDLSDGMIKVIYNDGSSEEIKMLNEQVEIAGFSNEKEGKITLTVTYKSKKVTFDIEIVPEEIIEEEIPINSNFENAYCKIVDAKYYAFSNSSQSSYYLELVLSISGIIKNDCNENYEYYYYISSNYNEEDIIDWVKINNGNILDGKLEFSVNSKDIKNYSKISELNNIYVYIKEIAKIGGSQTIKCTEAIKIDSDILLESYVDNIKVDNKNTSNIANDSTDIKDEDTTVIGGILPQTGVRSVLIIIIIVSIIGVTIYIKYIKLNREVK